MSGNRAIEDMDDAEHVRAAEADDWVSVGSLEERREFWKSAAQQTVEGKRQRISISIPERDLSRLKAMALEQGLPYQTLINSILHKYVSR